MDVLVNLSAINSHLYEAKPVARQHQLAFMQPRRSDNLYYLHT